MAESSISSGISHISSIALTLLMISATMAVGFSIINAMAGVGAGMQRTIQTRFTIMGTSEINASSTSLTVYAKNLGTESLGMQTLDELFLAINGEYVAFNGDGATTHAFTATVLNDFNGDGKWSRSESIAIEIQLQDGKSLKPGTNTIRLNWNGVSVVETFSV